MNTYAVKQFFESNTDITECFETSDGVLFKTEDEANAWAEGKRGMTVSTHTRPDPVALNLVDYVVTEQDLITNPALAEEGIKPGDVIQVEADGVYEIK
jgi:hypothetical protein